MRIVRPLVVLAMLAVAGTVAIMAAKDVSVLNELSRRIEEQREEKRQVVRERGEVNKRIDTVGEQVKELPDSARSGVAMKKGAELGKQMHLLDMRELRANKRIQNAQAARDEIKSRLRGRGVRTGVAFLVLLGVFMWFRKRSTRSGTGDIDTQQIKTLQ